MWINDGSLAKQSYAHAFAWSNESTFQKRDTSNISILRCSFHKTAKRLSITGLTHLSRLRPKIQSSIVRHNKHVTTWLQLYRNVILLQTKQEKKYEVSQTTLNCQCDWQIFAVIQNGDTKDHGLDYFKKNQFTEDIQLTWTIISQIYRKKKICLQALTIQNLSLIFVIQQQCDKIAYLEVMLHSTKSNSTLDAPKTFWMTPNTVI